jgi:hypothetical protein
LPSRSTGIPVNCNASTVKSAVQSIIVGTTNSPKGTPKNRNSSGNRIVSATSKPNTAGTASTSIATMANCDAALTTTTSDTSHSKASSSSANSAHGCARGVNSARRARWRQMSHRLIGSTSRQWAKVSERHQMPTMTIAVSR